MGQLVGGFEGLYGQTHEGVKLGSKVGWGAMEWEEEEEG